MRFKLIKPWVFGLLQFDFTRRGCSCQCILLLDNDADAFYWMLILVNFFGYWYRSILLDVYAYVFYRILMLMYYIGRWFHFILLDIFVHCLDRPMFTGITIKTNKKFNIKRSNLYCNWTRFASPKLLCHFYCIYLVNFAYCYHSFNVISSASTALHTLVFLVLISSIGPFFNIVSNF